MDMESLVRKYVRGFELAQGGGVEILGSLREEGGYMGMWMAWDEGEVVSRGWSMRVPRA